MTRTRDISIIGTMIYQLNLNYHSITKCVLDELNLSKLLSQPNDNFQLTVTLLSSKPLTSNFKVKPRLFLKSKSKVKSISEKKFPTFALFVFKLISVGSTDSAVWSNWFLKTVER